MGQNFKPMCVQNSSRQAGDMRGMHTAPYSTEKKAQHALGPSEEDCRVNQGVHLP